MAKKAKAKTEVYHPDEAELRRWCVEQALRWPMTGGHGGYAGTAQGGYVPVQEANIINRAECLLKWVTGR